MPFPPLHPVPAAPPPAARRLRAPGLVLGCALLIPAPVDADASGPVYASPATRAVIEKMVAAHGGLERWRSAPAIRFDSSLEVHFGGDNWVPFAEEAVVDPRTRRVYAKLPNADGTFGRIAFDGTRAWSAGELRGIARAPARFTAWRNFYLFSLPWMTQDPGVRLSEPGHARLHGESKDCITVTMTFDAGTGDTPKDHYVLYVDPDTHRLRAAEYVMTYASMMRDGVSESPPSIFMWEETATVDGFVVPTRYTVYWSRDHSVAVRNGTIRNWAFGARFDPSQLEMPEGATVDRSTP